MLAANITTTQVDVDLGDIKAEVDRHNLGTSDVSGVTGLHENTVRAAAHRGDLKFIRVGKEMRFAPADVAAWLGIK